MFFTQSANLHASANESNAGKACDIVNLYLSRIPNSLRWETSHKMRLYRPHGPRDWQFEFFAQPTNDRRSAQSARLWQTQRNTQSLRSFTNFPWPMANRRSTRQPGASCPLLPAVPPFPVRVSVDNMCARCAHDRGCGILPQQPRGDSLVACSGRASNLTLSAVVLPAFHWSIEQCSTPCDSFPAVLNCQMSLGSGC